MDIVITLTILGLSVVVFVWNRLPVEMVALLTSLALLATGMIGFDDVFEGFASPTIALIAALFVVAEGIDAAGITTWLGSLLVRLAGTSRARLLILIMSAVALLTALISVNGAVAALLPMIVVLCVRLGRMPSKVLLPMVFAAHAGSLLVLTGSPVNILIAQAAHDSGGEIGFFEFGLVGVPIFVGTVLVALLLGEKLLPERRGETPRDLSAHSRVLKEHYLADQRLARVRILAGSPLIGRTPWLGLAADELMPEPAAVHVLSPQTGRGRPLTGRDLIAGDQLVVRGRDAELLDFCERLGLEIDSTNSELLLKNGLINKEFGVAEVLIPPRSSLVGTSVYPGMVTESEQLVVLAHQRVGERLGEQPTTIMPGDSLLLQGRWDALDEHTAGDDVILVDSPDAIRRQAVPLGPRAKPAVIILVLMVASLTVDLIPAAISCVLAAIAMVLFRVVTPKQAHRSMQWQTLILVAAMFPMSTAITDTGVAHLLAHGIVDLVGGSSPYLYLLGLSLVTVILGQLISNTATALILIPIGISVAAQAHISPLTVLMAISTVSSAALLTPVATASNTMVMQPAGYRFGDYWKFGGAVMVIYLAVAVLLVPVFWPFGG
ncbi:SLC13 family permease [Microlunatus elymi]|uniref:SLC13 family permease n=1 Tax=Microlunatus elymi TaxID=2596828 RepID=A0A516PZW3_9ACTN|nr:SLC13 family permease [Microlunatus elymi]QDP96710.1 SLC13 family permease [Microlunatus elymi]